MRPDYCHSCSINSALKIKLLQQLFQRWKKFQKWKKQHCVRPCKTPPRVPWQLIWKSQKSQGPNWITFSEWPSQSHAQNPIEMLWQDLKQAVYAKTLHCGWTKVVLQRGVGQTLPAASMSNYQKCLAAVTVSQADF